MLHSYVKGSGSLDTLEDARAILNGVHLAVNDAAYRVQIFANNTACNIDEIEDTIKHMVNVLGVSRCALWVAACALRVWPRPPCSALAVPCKARGCGREGGGGACGAT